MRNFQGDGRHGRRVVQSLVVKLRIHSSYTESQSLLFHDFGGTIGGTKEKSQKALLKSMQQNWTRGDAAFAVNRSYCNIRAMSLLPVE